MRGGKAGAHLIDDPRGPVPDVVVGETKNAKTLRDGENLFRPIVRLHVGALVDRPIDLNEKERGGVSEIEREVADRDLTAECVPFD